MKLMPVRSALSALGALFVFAVAAEVGAESLTKDQALDKIERIEHARTRLKDLANAPVPAGLADSDARKYKNQQALVDVAASKLRLEAFELKRAVRKAKGPDARIPFDLGVSASDITDGRAASSGAVGDLNAKAVKIIAAIDSDEPMAVQAPTSQMLNRQQVEAKIESLQTASEALLALSQKPGPSGLSPTEQQSFTQNQKRTELMSKRLLLQKLQLQRSLVKLKGDEQTIPFELTVSRADVAATGRRSSIPAVQTLYQSIGVILDRI